MFNDELKKEQCQELLRKLADCAFPFVCAHGRPSVVPLVGMEGGVCRDVQGWVSMSDGFKKEGTTKGHLGSGATVAGKSIGMSAIEESRTALFLDSWRAWREVERR